MSLSAALKAIGIASTIGMGAFELIRRRMQNRVQDNAKSMASDPKAITSNSLIEYTQIARVEPIVLIENTLTFHDAMPDIQQTILQIFSGYYLQAIAMDATVGNISVRRTLDKLNPNRNVGDSIVAAGLLAVGTENLDEGPKLPNLGLNQTFQLRPAIEAFKESARLEASMESSDEHTDYLKEVKVQKDIYKKDRFGNNILNDKGQPIKVGTVTSTYKDSDAAERKLQMADAIRESKELANLAVGKLLNVEITREGVSASVPVAVRLQTASMPADHIVSFLAFGDRDLSAKERYHGWRSGRLEFWKDIIFVKDQLEQDRKRRLQDKSGMYSKITDQKLRNKIASLVSLNPTVATMSNVVVISEETLKRLESEINQRFTNFNIREKIFKETSLMLFVVVDTLRNRVKIYHQSIPQPTELSFNEIKRASKDSGSNIADILAAFQVGQAPSFR